MGAYSGIYFIWPETSSTLEAECAGQGLDWEEVLEQRAREKAKLTELGLTTENSIQKEVETSRETNESGNFS